MKSTSLALTLALLLASAAHAQTAVPNGSRLRTDMPSLVDPAVAALRDRALHDDTALDVVTGLTTEIGPRPDGSAAEGRARDWAVAKLKALGFANVHVEPFMVATWQRGTENAAVVAPYEQPLHIAGLGNSGATPSGGLTLPIAYFASYNELLLAPVGSLSGKIAFVTNAMQPTMDGSSYGAEGRARFQGPSEAAKRGAAAIVIRSIGTDHSRAPHTGVTEFAPGVTPIPAAALSVSDAENLERMILSAHKSGKPVMLHLELDDHQIGMRPSGNVIAEVPGTDPAAGVIVIGGHLDSWDLATGAIDDGAGVAITTAAARLMMTTATTTTTGPHRRTIRVVWFGDEETGGFGGQAYAKAHATEPHALAAESDVGADRVWRFGTAFPESAAAVIARLTVALAPLGVVHGSKLVDGGTDVEPMLALGTSGIDLNQSALHYFDVHHTAEDTLDQIDPAQLRQNVAAWTTVLAILADAPESLLRANH